MRGRGGRGRGRPPRTPQPRSANFLRKPKAFGGGFVGDNNSRSGTPINISPFGTPTMEKYEKSKSRDASNKNRAFIQHLYDDDDELSRDSTATGAGSLGQDENENLDDISNVDDGDSDVSFNYEDESDSDFSLESNSNTSKRKVVYFQRPKSPNIPDDADMPPLILPPSSNDLLIPMEYIMQCLGIYEVLRHFRTIVRLSPFTYEDFCASLLGEEHCTLYAEIHIMLMKAILREEDGNSTTFGPSDCKDSINVSFFFNDTMTWPEIARAYLESDPCCSIDSRDVISVLDMPDFPFVSMSDKLKVLQALTDLFLSTNKVREEILNEGNIQYDDHCRACHKLGDLLCCETCSAVYHLTCVDPPMEEVPDDDWLCSVCRAHQVKGVTDCTSEAERGGLICRQDPIGYDRHGRKYWFLVRRLVVEGDNEVWYYSTKGQIEELLEVFDRTGYERELSFVINDLKDDIIRHMNITEELTKEKCANKKSAIEVENASLEKIKSERAKRKAAEQAEKLAREEEERKAQEEMIHKKWAQEEQMLNGGVQDMDTSAALVTDKSENHSRSDSSTAVMTEIISTTEAAPNRASDSVETTTATTSKTTTTIRVSLDSDQKEIVKSIQPRVIIIGSKSEENESPPKGDMKVETVNGNSFSSESSQHKSVPNIVINKGTESKVIVIGSDGKQTPGIMNIQSVCPSAKPASKFVLVSKEGCQGKINLPPEKPEKSEDNKSENENGQGGSRQMVTRSKTGSLTPKLFSDSVMGTCIKTTTTNVKSQNSSSSDEVVVINKDGEITRVTRSKLASSTSIFSQQQYFKLGMDGSYKQYVNQYSTQTLALNKHQHNEERDKRRYLSHKFSLINLSEFKWNGTINGNRIMTVSTLRLTLSQLESSISSPLLHANWQLHRQSWLKALHQCTKPEDFALAMSILESVIKPVLLLPVWHEALGHIYLKRITSLDREEMKKKEKEQRKFGDDESARLPIWIKYTLGLKHQVWKQKGEEYRVTGGQGWAWISCTRQSMPIHQDMVGLRASAKKLQHRKLKLMAGTSSDVGDEDKDTADINDDEKSENVKNEIENMDMTDVVKTEVKAEVSSSSLPEMKKEYKMENNPYNHLSSKDKDMKLETEMENIDNVCNKKEQNEIKDEAKDEAIIEGEVKIEKLPGCAKINVKVEQAIDLDIEKCSPKKGMKLIRLAQGNMSKANIKPYSLLTHKCDVDLIDVSKAITEHTYYPKVTKPYSRLDNLLERRLKLVDIEQKQRDSIEQQIQWKLKLEAAKHEKVQLSASPEKKIISFSRHTTVEKVELAKPKPVKYCCYSPLCRKGDAFGGQCYSIRCRQFKSEQEEEDEELDVDDTGDVEMEVDEDDDDKMEEVGKSDEKCLLNKSTTDDEEVDVIGDKDIEVIDKTASVNINTNNNASCDKTHPNVIHVGITKEESKSSTAGVSVKSAIASPIIKKTTTISIPGNLAQLIAQKTGQNLTYSQAQAFIRQALEKMSVDELKAKLPPIRQTRDRVHLLKIAKAGVKKKTLKKSSLPPILKFLTPSGKRSLFVLEKWEARKVARKGGKTEVQGFKYDCKMSIVDWHYPCPRPLFKTAFRYRLQTVKSLAAVALYLRIIWACIRWDDMAVKPPAGGTNTVSTETEITTMELLKRKDIGPYNLRSEFLIRKIIVPLGVPQQPKEKYTPQRSGLRERKRPESPKVIEPSVTEIWVPEEMLELWEIKMFGEKVEKQRAALQEKLSTQQAQQNASQIKQQLEDQLKQQRAVMQQKRLLETQGKTTITTIMNSSGSLLQTGGTTTVLKGLGSLTTGSTLLKTSGGMTAIISPNTLIKKIQQVQPKTTVAGLMTSTATTTQGIVRPMVKVQIAGSTGSITLRPTATNIMLAPKPNTVTVTAAPTPTLTAVKLGTAVNPVNPGQQIFMKAIGGQVKPTIASPVSSTETTSGTQNVQIIQGPNGQLQVRGLLPGQQVIRLPDGRLQLITIPQQRQQQQIQATVAQSVSEVSVMQTVTPARTIQVQSDQVRASTVLVNSTTGMPVTVSAAVTEQIMVTSQGEMQSSVKVASLQSTGNMSVLTSSGPNIARIISPGKAQLIQKVGPGNPVVAITNTPQGTRIIRHITPQIIVTGQQNPNLQQKQLQLQQQQQVLAHQQAQIQQALQQQIKLQSGQIIQVVSAPVTGGTVAGQQTITVTPQQLAALQQQQLRHVKTVEMSPIAGSAVQHSEGNQSGISIQGQLIKHLQGQQAEGKSLLQSPVKSPTPGSPPAVVSSISKTAGGIHQKYAVTPQVVQEVVRQALLQNPASEIQVKLLAMQKHMVQQKQEVKNIIPIATPTTQRPELVSIIETIDKQTNKPRVSTTNLTHEQKEEHARIALCSQVLKGVLDKIEREEKKEHKLQKKQESVEEKQKRLTATKVQQILYKHKEALKKEIQGKRTVNEKNMVMEIQNEIEDAMRTYQPAGSRKRTVSGRHTVVPTAIVSCKKQEEAAKPQPSLPPMPPSSAQVAEAAKAKKKKQKLISTGSIPKSLNPKQKLYCVCKTPYDDARFYIGCDLCSNWFHGECVNISENQSKYIDAFVCDDCKKQQEVATEELYCLCKTPYDESRFYVGCDRCQDWFHCECVGITQAEADELDSYICPNCQQKDQEDPINLKELTEKDYDLLYRLMHSLKSHKMGWPFLEAVDPTEVPDYYNIVKDPMDLSQVEANLDDHQYRRLTDFIKDVTKIFNNCRLYNPPDTPFFQCAEVLETFFVQRIKTLKDKFLHS